MQLSSDIIILMAALGAVLFLFTTDHFFRERENRAEQELEETKEQASSSAFLEISDKDEEQNLAA